VLHSGANFFSSKCAYPFPPFEVEVAIMLDWKKACISLFFERESG